MIVLAFGWLILIILQLLGNQGHTVALLSQTIWGIFVVDFVIEFAIAPDKKKYLIQNWLTALALLLPAMRVFRTVRLVRSLRILRVARGARTVKIFSSLNRGMHALRKSMRRRGFGFVLAFTLIINFAGAAGMFAFERDLGLGHGFDSYWTALWWTAMILTTMGSAYWPQTPEGRILCLFLAIYAFSVFGYFTAILATYFIGSSPKKQGTGAEDL